MWTAKIRHVIKWPGREAGGNFSMDCGVELLRLEVSNGFTAVDKFTLSKRARQDYGFSMRRRIIFLVVGLSIVAATAEIVVRPDRPVRPPQKSPGVPDPKGTEVDPAVPAAVDTIEMRNGDRLRGRLDAIDAKEGVRFVYEGAMDSLRFKPSAVSRITFAESKQSPAAEGIQFRLALANGDEITGTLVDLTAEAIAIESALAGRLTIPRAAIVQLARVSSLQTIYDGPNHANEWRHFRADIEDDMVEEAPLPFLGRANLGFFRGLIAAKGQAAGGGWAFRNNGWVSQKPGAVLYRSFQLPDRYELEFDLAWRGELQFGIIFDALKPQLGNGDSHHLVINPESIDLMRYTANGEANGLGNTNLPGLRKKNHARFTLRVDSERGVIVLIVDGQIVREWRDIQKKSAGKIIGFNSDGGAVRLERIQVEHWDGQTLLKAANVPVGKGELVRLLNGDSIAGTVKSGQAGKFQIDSSFGIVEIGFDRVRQIEFAPGAPIEQKNAEWVLGTFPRRQKALFKIEKWSPTEVTILSPVWGRATIQRETLRSIEFNLGQPRQFNGDASDF